MKRTFMQKLYSVLILLGCIAFLVYKFVFIRNPERPYRVANKIGHVINPVPYTDYFYIQQAQPSVFFTTPAFPSYTKWCHENKKLCSVLPIQQIYADTQWIGSIQFVGSQDKPNKNLWLSKLLDNLTNLSPYWDYPYAFAQLLVPMGKKQVFWESEEDIEQSWLDAKILAERWEYFICDPNKVSAISNLDEKRFINTVYNPVEKQKYWNPCPTYERSHYAGFNAFYYRKNAEDAARNYKISSFTDWAPGLAPIMAALVYGRWGDHIKSASIWYDKFLSLSEQHPNPDEIIYKEIDESMKKSVFELQLQLITDADNDSNKVCEQSYDCLQQKGFIKAAVNKSYNDICKKGTDYENIRCVLLRVGIEKKWIGLDGSLRYPLNDNFVYAWSTEYKSRWIEGKKDMSMLTGS